MAIEFECEHCNTTLRVSDKHAGKRAKCPKCQAVNLIQPRQSSPVGFDAPEPVPPQPSYQESGGSIESYFNEDSPAAVTTTKAMLNPYAAGSAGAVGGYSQPHRGPMVLTLGILSLVCNIMLVPGIMAWILGRADLKAIDAGRMDPEGRGMTMAGMVLGIIGTVLPILFFLLYMLVIIVVVFAGVAGAR